MLHSRLPAAVDAIWRDYCRDRGVAQAHSCLGMLQFYWEVVNGPVLRLEDSMQAIAYIFDLRVGLLVVLPFSLRTANNNHARFASFCLRLLVQWKCQSVIFIRSIDVEMARLRLRFAVLIPSSLHVGEWTALLCFTLTVRVSLWHNEFFTCMFSD